MPPTGSGNVVNCADGFTCARTMQNAWWGSDVPVKLGCGYGYNLYGQLSSAICDGRSGTGASRIGIAFLYCETGEYLTSAGCVAKPPADKNSDCRTQTANPVDTRSGRKIEASLDFTTEGANALEFRRYYTSDTSYLFGKFGASRLGLGWRSNFDASAFYEGSPGSWAYGVSVVLPDGRYYTFRWNFSTSYAQSYFKWSTKSWITGTQTDVAKLVRNVSASRYELTTSDDTLWSFDHSGRLRTITYRGGYTQELTYDASGNNTLVQDSYGRQLSFAYTARGLLSTTTVPGGQVYKYAYLGRYDPAIFGGVSTDLIGPQFWALQFVTFPDDNSDPDDNPKVEYHYENASFKYALTGITDEKGVRWATWTYNSFGRVVLSEHADSTDTFGFSYNDAALTATVTNPLTKQTVYHFSLDLRSLPRLTQIEGVASSHCAAANTSYAYDSAGFLNQITDGEGRVTRMVNNSSRGLPTSITRGYGTPGAVTDTYTWHSTLIVPTQIVEPGLTVAFTWNTSGQLTQLTQTDTTTTTVPYSTNGQTRRWAYTYTTGGLLASVDGPLSGTGDTISYTYNSSGFVQTVTDEVGHVTQFTAWNGRGQPTSMTDPNGVVSSLTYDALGRLKTVTVDPGGAPAETSFDYDTVGQITKITRPNGAYLQYTWDDARRLIKVEDNSGAFIEYDRDVAGNETGRRIKNFGGSVLLTQTAAFDELSRLLTFVGASAQTWTFAYDKTDNRVAVTDPRSHVYHWAFDALDRLISETDEDNATVTLTRNGKDEITNYSDPRSLSTAYVRDGFGDIIRRNSPDTGITDYVYNKLGKPTQITDARSVVTNLTYDNAGRLLTREYPAATGENITYTLGCDRLGQ